MTTRTLQSIKAKYRKWRRSTSPTTRATLVVSIRSMSMTNTLGALTLWYFTLRNTHAFALGQVFRHFQYVVHGLYISCSQTQCHRHLNISLCPVRDSNMGPLEHLPRAFTTAAFPLQKTQTMKAPVLSSAVSCLAAISLKRGKLAGWVGNDDRFWLESSFVNETHKSVCSNDARAQFSKEYCT